MTEKQGETKTDEVSTLLAECQPSRCSREICLSGLMSRASAHHPPRRDIDIMNIDVLRPPSRYPTECNKTHTPDRRAFKILYKIRPCVERLKKIISARLIVFYGEFDGKLSQFLLNEFFKCKRGFFSRRRSNSN